jgi:enterochelin esterase-like enzyme
MAERRIRPRSMAHRSRRAGFAGLGLLASLLLVTGVVRATGLPWPTASPGRSSIPATATPATAVPAAAAPATAAPVAASLAAADSIASAILTPAPTPTPEPATTTAPVTGTSLVWSPSGAGQVTVVNMPAPWIGGSKRTADVSIYTPAGYDPTGTQLYPVIYEAPTGLALWNGETGAISELNSLIDSGAMPAAIVVFIDESGAPMMPTECVDSANKQQWLETFISKTVVDYVDQNYRTIQDPKARAIMGLSEGGFCATVLAMRHPDIFSVDIAFSGYYWAGTPSVAAALPYGGQASLIDAYSPALLAPQIADQYRSSLYFILASQASQDYFGPQFTNFEEILEANGFDYLAIDSTYPHGWAQAEYWTPAALTVWGAQLEIIGV